MAVSASWRGISIGLLPGASTSGKGNDVLQFAGTGAPVGGVIPQNGQVMDADQAAVYWRRDGAIGSFMYGTIDGGTTWTAFDPTALVSHDLNGGDLILDPTGNSTLSAAVDNTVVLTINSAADFQWTANTFAALAGSVITTNTINETTATSGVTIDSLLVKDHGIAWEALGAGQDLTIALTGAFDASVAISSTGTGTDAIGIVASAGGITMTSTAVASSWTHTATGAADDLTIAVAGAVDASLVLASAGTAADALTVTSSAGGMDITAALALDLVGTGALNAGDGIGFLTYDGAGGFSMTGTTTVEIDGSGIVAIESSAGAINIGADAVAQAINIGTGAAARVLTIGNAASASLALEAGVGGATLNADTTLTATIGTDVLIDAAGATSQGVLRCGTDTAASQWSIQNDSAADLLAVTGAGVATSTEGGIRPIEIADPGPAGAIPVTYVNATCSLTSTGAGAEARTLAIPTFAGQRLTLVQTVLGAGGDVITITVASAFDVTGHTTLAFNAVWDHVDLVSATVAGALHWLVVSNTGVVAA